MTPTLFAMPSTTANDDILARPEDPFLPWDGPCRKCIHMDPSEISVYHGRTKRLKALVLLLAGVLTIRTMIDIRQLFVHTPAAMATVEGGRHILTPIPELASKRMEFYNASAEYGLWKIPWTEDEWMRWYGNWQRLWPRGQGMVKIMHPDQYPDLPPAMKDFEGRDPPADGGYRFGVAVTHQLHCLWSLQRYFYEVQGGKRPGNHHTTLFHINHCTDYLRWTILCHSDTTIEGWDKEQLRVHNNPGVTGPSGLHNQHQCRDYNQLFEWMEDNRWHDRKAGDHDILENSTYADFEDTWNMLNKWIAEGN